jgi:3-phosphoglycerate kinase
MMRNMEMKAWTMGDIGIGTRVFLRIDANVSIKKGLADDGEKGRIAQTVPEIIRLCAHGARVILATHLGDPKGQDEKFSVKPVARALEKRLRREVRVLDGVVGREVHKHILEMEPGEIVMLENLRFEAGEEENDAHFAKSLAELADVYINNAFGVCHRQHASVVGITKYLPSFAGGLLHKEIAALSKPELHPFILVMGGAKLSTKIPILEHLGHKADKILLGGAICLPFLKALELPLPIEPEGLVTKEDVRGAKAVIKKYKHKLVVPIDLVIDEKEEHVLDIGPETIELFQAELKGAKDVLWNGPMGIVEMSDGKKGTELLAKTLLKKKPRQSVMGGGDTVDFLEKKKLLGGFTHVSTGGGAMLAYLSGEKLPGLEVLK